MAPRVRLREQAEALSLQPTATPPGAATRPQAAQERVDDEGLHDGHGRAARSPLYRCHLSAQQR